MGAAKMIRKQQQHWFGYARPKPTSSHPDADPPFAKPLVTESDLNDYQNADPPGKAIVSINGEDVEDLHTGRRAA